MYRKIESLEAKTAQLQTELDALKERLGENEKQTKYDIERHWNAICDLRYAGQERKQAAAPEPGVAMIGSQPSAVASASATAKPGAENRPPRLAAPLPVGFPWALVVQILMAILTYLIQRAVTKSERDHLAELKSQLVRQTGGTE